MKLKQRWIVGLVLICSTILFFQWREGAFLTLEGDLFLSGPVKEMPFVANLDSRKVYKVSLDGRFQAIPYYSIDDFNEIRLSEKSEIGDIYVAKHFKEKYYAVLLVQNGFVKELMRSSTEVVFPTLRDDGQNIVYFGRGEDNQYKYKLYRYNIQAKTSKRISNTPVVWWSRPIFGPDESVYFAALGNYSLSKSGIQDDIRVWEATIMKINKNGELQAIVSGMFPIWMENGKSLFYYDFVAKEIRIYDIRAKISKTISRETWVLSHPALSNNGKYLAFHEGVITGPSLKIRLYVMSVDGWNKREIFNSDVPLSSYNRSVSELLWGK